MATPITLKNTQTGETKTAYYGFSWTTFFFGAFPALFRSDWITFIGAFVIYSVLTAMTVVGGFIAMIVWAFMYNRYHTLKLIKDGFKFAGSPEDNQRAALELKIELTEFNTIQ